MFRRYQYQRDLRGIMATALLNVPFNLFSSGNKGCSVNEEKLRIVVFVYRVRMKVTLAEIVLII